MLFNTTEDWLAPISPTEEALRCRRHKDVSQDPRYNTKTTTTGDKKCIAAPAHILVRILPRETQDSIFKAGHGTAPDHIYARKISSTPEPGPCAIDRKKSNLILIEVGFCRDFGCQSKLQEKTDKYAPLGASLQTIWGKVELMAVPIDHAGPTLIKIRHSLAHAMSATRPEIERNRTRREVINPDTDTAARSHESSIFKSLMQTLTKLAQSRFVGIVYHRQILVKAQVGIISRTQAHLDATPAHTQESPQHQHHVGHSKHNKCTHRIPRRAPRSHSAG